MVIVLGGRGVLGNLGVEFQVFHVNLFMFL